ncbi:MAG: hypothetical protein RBS39_04330 [Phycisphaerales bacterium]|nr:hypothetical protein [Phycisphaerales bacterium]
MTQLSAHAAHHHADDHASDLAQRLEHDNIYLPAGTGNGLSVTLIGIGVFAIAATVLAGMTVGVKHALASYHVGAMCVLAVCLGATFWTMVLHLTNAGWSSTIRRQLENISSLMPLALLLVAPVLIIEVALQGRLFTWMSPEHAGDILLEKKRAFLNVPFFVVRALIYSAVWLFLSSRLRAVSMQVERTGDPNLIRKVRFMSGWGLLAFALTTAFASFDWLMAMDWRFFSTMWGVYYFAGAAMSAMALTALVLAILRGMGRLTGVVTKEHFHDVGKLCFAFTVFWTYIAFSQYFLIWYSNIPEETAFYLYRSEHGWLTLGAILCAGHFVLPFLFLMPRTIKRSTVGLAAGAVWLLVMQVLDIVWIVRPMVYAGEGVTPGSPVNWWVDFVAILGVLCVFAGVLVKRVASGSLIPLNDPYLKEALTHNNAV